MRRPCAAFLSALRFAPPGFCPSFAFRSAWLLLCAPAWLSLLRYAHAWLLPCVVFRSALAFALAFRSALALLCVPLGLCLALRSARLLPCVVFRSALAFALAFRSALALRSAWSLPRVALRPALALRFRPALTLHCVPLGLFGRPTAPFALSRFFVPVRLGSRLFPCFTFYFILPLFLPLSRGLVQIFL